MPSEEPSPRRLPLSHRRAFVQRHTRLRDIDGVPGIRLHVADAVEPVWAAVEEALGIDGAPIPFWAFAWAGGIALARWIGEHPHEVAGRSVLDFGTGSGLVAIAAAQTGASHVTAVDVDPFAEAAVALNARANHVHVTYAGRDLLDGPPPATDVLLAGDTWYESPLAERVLPWLRAAAARGTRVLVGDPSRKHFPATAREVGFVELATYEVRTTTTLEDAEAVTSRVFAIEPPEASGILEGMDGSAHDPPDDLVAAVDAYPNGQARFHGQYLGDEMHGDWEFFRTDGTVMRSGSFDRGRQIAVWRTFARDGRLVSEKDLGNGT